MKGVTCYVSRAKTGGIKGGLGLAEDKSEASIACRQTGPISFPKPLKQQDEMFSERISLVVKRLRVVRMVDATRNTLVCLPPGHLFSARSCLVQTGFVSG